MPTRAGEGGKEGLVVDLGRGESGGNGVMARPPAMALCTVVAAKHQCLFAPGEGEKEGLEVDLGRGGEVGAGAGSEEAVTGRWPGEG